jgi:hypothetical protein
LAHACSCVAASFRMARGFAHDILGSLLGLTSTELG